VQQCQAVPIELTASQRTLLTAQAQTATAPYRQVLRAKIVLLAVAGLANATIARRLAVTVNTVRKWHGRFAAEGQAGLAGPSPASYQRSTACR
jgi:DNA-directed RNA polymerase specialized sigma24 family protein